MKQKILYLFAVLCFLLAGCSGFTRDPYIVVRPHVEETAASSPLSVITSYADLRYALEAFISDGQEFGILYYQDYDEEILEKDLKIVTDYVTEKYPLGAYAIKDISYETGNASNGHAIAFTLSYHHSRSDIKKLKSVNSLPEAKETVYNALSHCDSDLLISVDGYIPTDFVQVIEDYALENPDIVMETPNVSVAEYPDSGSSRILEFKFTYSTSRDTLRNMKNTVTPIFSSATLYVSKDSEPEEKISQLYAFLSQRYEYRFESSVTPAYSLLRHGVGDSRAFASVYAAMCRNVDVTCYLVSGTKSGQPYYWNILSDGESFYHVDIMQCIAEDCFLQKSDAEMQDYVWNYTEFPSCEGRQETIEIIEE